ncbi:MAG: nucleoside deaminase [Chitinophagia bacterium]|nr:nucleoside deaminase [Chitinophagia bacterium]
MKSSAQETSKVRNGIQTEGRTILTPLSKEAHERNMRKAIEAARANPRYPFGAVIVRVETGEVMATGVNHSSENPILHGEIDCMNDYVRRNGNRGWAGMMLYTTGEPCSMCMSALVWSGIGGVVYASSIDGIRKAGIGQIGMTARQVLDASPFGEIYLLGGILAEETDRMFLERQR